MNKNLPILIIIIVLIAAIVGGIALFRTPSTSKTPPGNQDVNRTQDAAKKFQDLLAKAPSGAQPAWSKGDPAAKITLEEFADFSCPTCANFHQALKEIEKSYGQKIRIVYHHFPLQIKGHENSYNASRAAEAAGIQGRFWEMQNMLFTYQKTWTVQPESDARNSFAEYAKSIGINVDKFKEDMLNSQNTSARVADDMKRGQALNVNSTPTVILNGRMLVNSEILNVSELRQAIENELQKVQPPAANTNTGNANSQ